MVTANGMFDSILHPVLTDQSVHIWQARLEQPEAALQLLGGTLSDDERERAGRFLFGHLRRSFIAARGILRSILALYINCKPGELQFEYSETGKPSLSQTFGTAGFAFNLSHSGDLVLYAITRKHRIGIDVEHIRPMNDMVNIATRTFSAAENEQLQIVSEGQRLTAFFQCWTRKEAYIKAIGEGLSFPLDQFDVSLKPGDPARILKIKGSEEDASRWSVHSWQPAQGYIAALAIDSNDISITHQEWTASSFTPVL